MTALTTILLVPEMLFASCFVFWEPSLEGNFPQTSKRLERRNRTMSTSPEFW